jgi:hypothetical protein
MIYSKLYISVRYTYNAYFKNSSCLYYVTEYKEDHFWLLNLIDSTFLAISCELLYYIYIHSHTDRDKKTLFTKEPKIYEMNTDVQAYNSIWACRP